MADNLDRLELAGARTDLLVELTDTCTIERITDKGTVNRTTAELVGETRDTIYTGICDCAPIRSRRDRFDTFGEALIFTRQYRVILPHDSADIQIRDIFTVTSSEDPEMVGRPMEVRDVHVTTDNIARTVTVHDSRE